MASIPGTDCSAVRLLLSALADGEATPEEAARAEAHVASCGACASHLAFLRLTGRALRRVPEVYPPADLSARIAAATYDRPTVSERLLGWLRPAPVRVAVGAMAAAGLAAVFLLPRVGPVVPQGPEATGVVPSASRQVASAGAAVRPKNVAAAPSGATAPGGVAPRVAAATARPAGRAKSGPAAAAAPLPAARVPLSEPVTVAAAGRPKSASMMARSAPAPSADEVVRALRTDALVDRHFPAARGLKAAAAPAPRKPRGGAAALVQPRSGYDRAAETLGALRGPDIASAGSVGVTPPPAAAAAAPPTPRAVPTPYAVAEQPAPKTLENEAPSAAATAAATYGGGTGGAFHLSTHSRRISNNAVIDTGDAKQQAAGRSEAPYAFNANQTIQGSVVGAPIQ